MGSLKGRGRFALRFASGCTGIFGSGRGFHGRFGALGRLGLRAGFAVTSAISMVAVQLGMGLENHHPKTVSTPPQDFAAQGFWAQEPLSHAHALERHPLSTCLHFDAVLAQITQLIQALREYGMVLSAGLAELHCIIPQL